MDLSSGTRFVMVEPWIDSQWGKAKRGQHYARYSFSKNRLTVQMEGTFYNGSFTQGLQ